MLEKQKIKINMTGKEYLEYEKYKDKNKIKWEKKDIIKLSYILGVSLVAIVAMILIQQAYYEPTKTVYTWEGILMFLCVCAGLGWIIHGTGFLLIRR